MVCGGGDPVASGGAAGSCTTTQSPPSRPRGERERPVVGVGDGVDDGQPESDTPVVGVDALGPALERLGERRTSCGVSFSPVFSTQSTTVPAPGWCVTHTVPRRAGCGRSRCARGWWPAAGAALATRWWGRRRRRSRWRRRASRRAAGGSRWRPPRAATGRRPRVKERWSARLSSSSASVSSIARVLTTWRRSTSSPLSRLGSSRATSSRVCVTARGVRSSWEALAANLFCSATCASSRASIVSNASASSRNSSLRPRAGSGGRANPWRRGGWPR